MNWEKTVAFVGAIPIFLLLALVCQVASVYLFGDPFGPGLVLLALVPLDWWPSGRSWTPVYMFLFGTVCWLVVITMVYGLIFKRRRLLRRMVLPFSLALAVICEGVAFQHVPFTPGAIIWRLVHSESSDYHPIALSFALLVDTTCWLGIFVAAYKFVPRLHRIVK